MRFEVDRALAEVLSGERDGFLPGLLRAAALPPSWLYGGAAIARNLLFDAGIRRAHRVPVPVASIGNITAGGTGKTPLVEWAARRLRERAGVPVAIVSRGYAAVEGGRNDEALVLAENLPGVPHVQRPDRVAAARQAVGRNGARVLLLDDGFQHRRLARDLDVVLLDALASPRSYRLLPRGVLREPLSGLKRADLIVITRVNQASAEGVEAARAIARRFAPGRPVAKAALRSVGQTFKDRRAFLFCGIGQPRSFEQSAKECCGEIAGRRFFHDHHAYRREEIDAIAAEARRRGADLLLTTQKDFVKVRALGAFALPIETLRIEVELRSGADVLEGALDRLAERAATLAPAT
jgi:tetraacyldisaccharide 4'-kinase